LENWGAFGHYRDTLGSEAGFYHPFPYQNCYVYGAGPWVGGIVNGETLVTVGFNPLNASSEFVPTLCRYWRQGYTDPRDRIYLYPEDWPPPRDRFPMAPIIPLSQQDMWCCFGDSDPQNHDTRALGIDVALTVYNWNTENAQDFFILKYEVFNHNTFPLQNMYFGIVLDGDVGDYYDDLAALLLNKLFTCSPPIETVRVKNAGFIYDYDNIEVGPNGWQGGVPGAVVVRLLSTQPEINLSAFKIFTPENIPLNDCERYLGMAGYSWYLNPPLYQPFDSMDAGPGDKKFILSCGPFNLIPESSAKFYFSVSVSRHGYWGETGPKHETVYVALGCYWAEEFFLEHIAGLGMEEIAEKRPLHSLCFAVHPNPFKSSLIISSPSNEEMEVKIYSSQGRLIKTIQKRTSILWDGRDENGNILSTGLYFLIVKIKEKTWTKKVLMIR
jgi:hypothetical protein